MNSVNSTITGLVLGLLLIFPLTSLATTDAGESIIQRGQVDDDYYAAGASVDLDAEVTGDATLAGGDLYIGRLIHGDLIAAGGTLRVRGKILDDIRIAGGEIDIEADIGDDLIASGGEIRVSSTSNIDGDAWLAGGEVYMAGVTHKNLSVAAGKFTLSGTVHGDVEIHAGEIEILDSARIHGNLTYTSPQPAGIQSEQSISGKVAYTKADWDDSPRGFGLFFAFTLMAASLVLYRLFPHFTLSSVRRISSNPWQSLATGLGLIVFTPLLAMLLIGIILGFWLGLSLIALYFITLLTGFLISLFYVGERGAKLLNKKVTSTRNRIISVIIAIILLAIVRMIPVIGAIVLFVLLMLGTGAAIWQLKFNYAESG